MAEIIRNDELLEAVTEMREAYKTDRENSTEETRNAINMANSKVINITLRSTFIIPAIINKNTQLVQDSSNHLKFEDKPQARFMLVKHKSNGTFFPIFTDVDEFGKIENKDGFQPVNMKFADIATLTEQTPNVTGFVINPVSTNLPYTKEMLASIKNTLIEARRKRDAENAANATGAETPGFTITGNGNN